MTKERAQEPKDGLKWPEWRLYANFLHRELARLWYGKKSVFTLVKGDRGITKFWAVFGLIWAMTIQRFGVARGLMIEGIAKRFKTEYDIGRGERFASSTPVHGIYWIVRGALGDKLSFEFLLDLQIAEIIALAVYAYGYATEGKMPPYAKDEPLRPLEFYEGLPVAPELEAQFYGKGLA